MFIRNKKFHNSNLSYNKHKMPWNFFIKKKKKIKSSTYSVSISTPKNSKTQTLIFYNSLVNKYRNEHVYDIVHNICIQKKRKKRIKNFINKWRSVLSVKRTKVTILMKCHLVFIFIVHLLIPSPSKKVCFSIITY